MIGDVTRSKIVEQGESMKITEVYFEKLISDGNFNNERIGARAEVEDGHYEIALKDLTEWVEAKHRERGACIQDAYALESRIHNLRYELSTIENDIKRARAAWEKAKEFLKKHGIDPDAIDDEIPF